MVELFIFSLILCGSISNDVDPFEIQTGDKITLNQIGPFTSILTVKRDGVTLQKIVQTKDNQAAIRMSIQKER